MGVILTLCFVGNQEKIINKPHVGIVISLNMIQYNLTERYVNDGGKVNIL